MKKALTIIAIIILAVLTIYNSYIANTQCVTHKEFKEFRTEFNERLNDVDENLDTIKLNIDTLRKGQEVIYDEIKKTNIPFWKKIF